MDWERSDCHCYMVQMQLLQLVDISLKSFAVANACSRSSSATWTWVIGFHFAFSTFRRWYLRACIGMELIFVRRQRHVKHEQRKHLWATSKSLAKLKIAGRMKKKVNDGMNAKKKSICWRLRGRHEVRCTNRTMKYEREKGIDMHRSSNIVKGHSHVSPTRNTYLKKIMTKLS